MQHGRVEEEEDDGDDVEDVEPIDKMVLRMLQFLLLAYSSLVVYSLRSQSL